MSVFNISKCGIWGLGAGVGFLDLESLNFRFRIWDFWIVQFGICLVLDVQIWGVEPKRGWARVPQGGDRETRGGPTLDSV